MRGLVGSLVVGVQVVDKLAVAIPAADKLVAVACIEVAAPARAVGVEALNTAVEVEVEAGGYCQRSVYDNNNIGLHDHNFLHYKKDIS